MQTKNFYIWLKPDGKKPIIKQALASNLHDAKILVQHFENCPLSDMYEMTAIEDVKKGDFFKRKPDAKKVLVKGEFNRSAKRYAANNFEDISDFQHFKKGTLVFTDFEF